MYRTPVANRLHICIVGVRNSGKSSLINALSGQDLAIVSEVEGTTTDPVYKTMEMLPIGPCMIIDTAGIDDISKLGQERIEKTMEMLRKADVGIIVTSPEQGIDSYEEGLVEHFKKEKIPFIIVVNKCDLGSPDMILEKAGSMGAITVALSCLSGEGIEELKTKIISIAPSEWTPVPLIKDVVRPGNKIVMVCPIDSAMPQGRLILPEVQVLREILDSDGIAVVTKETELDEALKGLDKAPDMVITDSQVFDIVKDIVPRTVPLTSFSIIFARHKGDLDLYVNGIKAVDTLEDGDEILIAEACTHHVQPEDIARTKIPTILLQHTGKDLNFTVTAGKEYPKDISKFKMIICCGGCMINRQEMMFRVNKARNNKIPVTNYGILIAYFSGILERVIEPFGKKVKETNINTVK